MGHAHAALRPIGPCGLAVQMPVFIIEFRIILLAVPVLVALVFHHLSYKPNAVTWVGCGGAIAPRASSSCIPGGSAFAASISPITVVTTFIPPGPGWSVVSVAVVIAPAVAATIAAAAFAAFPPSLATVSKSCLLGWPWLSSFVAVPLLPETWSLEQIFAERQYSRVVSRRLVTGVDSGVLVY